MYLAISTAFDMMAPEPAQIPHFLLIKKKKFLRFFPFFMQNNYLHMCKVCKHLRNFNLSRPGHNVKVIIALCENVQKAQVHVLFQNFQISFEK